MARNKTFFDFALIAIAAVGLTLSAESMAEDGGLVSRFPSGSIRSLEAADMALAEAAKERTAVEARFSYDEGECHSKFFAATCIDQAKERRRLALLQVRRIEIEANAFKRQARVDSRDEALERKKVQEEADRAAHLKREEESRKNEKKAPTSLEGGQESVPGSLDSQREAAAVPDRSAKHEAKIRRAEEKDAREAARRAENIAAYERKVKEAQAHQAEVAAKKAEKERKRRARESLTPNTLSNP